MSAKEITILQIEWASGSCILLADFKRVGREKRDKTLSTLKVSESFVVRQKVSTANTQAVLTHELATVITPKTQFDEEAARLFFFCVVCFRKKFVATVAT
jgi:hypothetical protein